MQKLLHDVISQGSDNLWRSNNYGFLFPPNAMKNIVHISFLLWKLMLIAI